MSPSLTHHDTAILQKIKDPESGPGFQQLIDDSLPRDPHITDPTQYRHLINQEQQTLHSIFVLECQNPPPATPYLGCVDSLTSLIEKDPKYASARNNRAQALRRLYGSGMLVKSLRREDVPHAEWEETWPMGSYAPSEVAARGACSTVLGDLETVISLLTPAPFATMSPQAAKTLAKAHTQRGALYHRASLNLKSDGAELRIDASRKEAAWGVEEFEERAQLDFALSARYGNEDAKKMMVANNPAAKLCGEIVKEAMRKEYRINGVDTDSPKAP